MIIVNYIDIEESNQNTMYKDEILYEIKVHKVYGKYNEYGVDIIERMCEATTITPK